MQFKLAHQLKAFTSDYRVSQLPQLNSHVFWPVIWVGDHHVTTDTV